MSKFITQSTSINHYVLLFTGLPVLTQVLTPRTKATEVGNLWPASVSQYKTTLTKKQICTKSMLWWFWKFFLEQVFQCDIILFSSRPASRFCLLTIWMLFMTSLSPIAWQTRIIFLADQLQLCLVCAVQLYSPLVTSLSSTLEA